jgi:hypothetical protein
MDTAVEFQDSGSRREFGTGAVRDAQDGKGRFDLLPFDAIQELARVFEEGAVKYKSRNWQQGIPIATFMDSACRHLHKAISGVTDEPHLGMAMWNIACAIQTAVWVEEGTLPSALKYDQPIRTFHGILGVEPCTQVMDILKSRTYEDIPQSYGSNYSEDKK